MPAYFYHLLLEVLPALHDSPLAIESAQEALLPFGIRPSNPSTPGAGCHSSSKGKIGKDLNLQHRPRHTDTSNRPVPPRDGSTSISSTASRAPDPDNDPRFGAISIECIDMNRTPKRGTTSASEENVVAAGIGTDILGGLRTKGRYIPLDQKVNDSTWGIVHLYRDAHETPYLTSNEDDYPIDLKGSAAAAPRNPTEQETQSSAGTSQKPSSGSTDSGTYPGSVSVSSARGTENDCTTLCILAVPSYLSPSDFLGFVGERTLDDVSHFRMIRTPRANRYMVLMKFRSGRRAMEWQKEWNGKVFNSMEPETCHVVFVKSVEIQVAGPGSPSAFLPADPSTQATLSSKPLAPPTPALIELPTCPVCLERMDETTGLLTIICQHVFHCTCLQKWKGSGCPVCRYTQDDVRKGVLATDPDGELAECAVCHTEFNLWACLICGSVGCGRYDGAHAFDHWKETTHPFAMDLTTQRVWDYVGDAYVHRIIQSKSDGKLVELPAADDSALDPPDWSDAVPREKLENMSVEYTHLLTSQLESQRAYFEEIVERAADKASQASAAAASAEQTATVASSRLLDLQAKYEELTTDTIPTLERDRSRLEKRAEKFESLAHRLENDYRTEKAMNRNLMERLDILGNENGELKASKADLEEQNRDLTFFISGSQRLQGQSEDITQGTVTVPEPKPEGKRKRNKGKGKK
ncbi:BRCA1-associated 2 [Penicillium capsulatum]|nr:BRCA1-associated 2 [Penicillium capsulatum]